MLAKLQALEQVGHDGTTSYLAHDTDKWTDAVLSNTSYLFLVNSLNQTNDPMDQSRYLVNASLRGFSGNQCWRRPVVAT